MKRFERTLLWIFLGMALGLLFIGISSLTPYAYLLLGVMGVLGIADAIYLWVTRSPKRVLGVVVLGALSALCFYLSWYLWLQPLTSLPFSIITSLLLGAILGTLILYLTRNWWRP